MLAQFNKMIYDYMEYRQNLSCAFVLIDVNVPPQKYDLAFINWMGEHGVPFVIVYTKIDRIKDSEKAGSIEAIQNAILETWNELPQQFYTSSETNEGRDELLSFINGLNEQAG